jgi:hypothetical protein
VYSSLAEAVFSGSALQKTIPDQSTDPNRQAQAQARTPKEAETQTNHRTTQRHDNTGEVVVVRV